MIDKFNRSEAYKLFRQIFNQLYGNTPALGVITYTDEGLVLSLIGTDETISLKNLPVGGAQGDIVYCNADGDWVRLAGNTTTTKKYLSQTGTGAVSAAPAWAQVAQADISGLTTSDGPTFDHLHITNQGDFTTVHTTTLLADHIGEHTGAHTVVFDNTITVGNTGLIVGTSTPFSDSSGTLTLQNVDAIDATTESTIEAAIDTLANLTSIQGQTVTISAELHVEAATHLNQDLTSDASPTFDQGNFTTVHTTTELVDHIGEHSSAHGVILDNDLTRVGTIKVDHLAEATGSHTIVCDNNLQVPAVKITTGAGADKVLTSDADGNATWEDASAGAGVDEVARDNIVLLAFKLAIQEGLSIFNLEDGFVDEFEDATGINDGDSTHESYSSTDDYYSPEASGTLDDFEYSTDALAQAAYVTNGVDTDQKQNTTGHTHSVTGSLALYAGALSDMSDGNTANYIIAISGNGTVRIDFGESTPKTIKKFRIFIAGDASITGCLFRGSNNATDWDTLITHPSEVISTNWSTQRTVSSPASYRYYEWVYNVGGSGVYLTEWELLGDNTNYQSYSESTIKSQGSYSLKGVAATGANGKTLTKTVSPAIDLSGIDSISLDIYSSRTGSNIKIGIHDSGGTTTELTPSISAANTWEVKSWDLSGVADANKNVIDQIIVTIVNADSANTFYIDNFLTSYENMTLISETVEAETEPTKARLIFLVEPVDSITINTDLLGYVSNDGGSNYDAVTLVDEGSFDASKTIYSGNVTLTDRSDKTMVVKAVTANNKNLKIHGWALLWS